MAQDPDRVTLTEKDVKLKTKAQTLTVSMCRTFSLTTFQFFVRNTQIPLFGNFIAVEHGLTKHEPSYNPKKGVSSFLAVLESTYGQKSGWN